ncbi:MAG: hypothetical protein WCG14_07055, partial [Chlamydiia bacterium]
FGCGSYVKIQNKRPLTAFPGKETLSHSLSPSKPFLRSIGSVCMKTLASPDKANIPTSAHQENAKAFSHQSQDLTRV